MRVESNVGAAKSPLQPPPPPLWLMPSSAVKLFVSGATVGPVVDSIHNRCLLQYDVAPINVEPFLHTSALIPPLLGLSYLVLGGILPRLVRWAVSNGDKYGENESISRTRSDASFLGARAGQAVASTVLIILLSLYLETTRTGSNADSTMMILGFFPSTSVTNVLFLSMAALWQWYALDRSGASLASAVLAALLGPLCELPFCGHGFWHYLPEACDYYPLEWLDEHGMIDPDSFPWDLVVGDKGLSSSSSSSSLDDLGLASITGPCYFAVTTDAIALGRWFDAQGMQPLRPQDDAATADRTGGGE